MIYTFAVVFSSDLGCLFRRDFVDRVVEALIIMPRYSKVAGGLYRRSKISLSEINTSYSQSRLRALSVSGSP